MLAKAEHNMPFGSLWFRCLSHEGHDDEKLHGNPHHAIFPGRHRTWVVYDVIILVVIVQVIPG